MKHNGHGFRGLYKLLPLIPYLITIGLANQFHERPDIGVIWIVEGTSSYLPHLSGIRLSGEELMNNLFWYWDSDLIFIFYQL